MAVFAHLAGEVEANPGVEGIRPRSRQGIEGIVKQKAENPKLFKNLRENFGDFLTDAKDWIYPLPGPRKALSV